MSVDRAEQSSPRDKFCPRGKFSTGKNEIDALKYAIMKVNESNNDNAVDDEEEAKVDKGSRFV